MLQNYGLAQFPYLVIYYLKMKIRDPEGSFVIWL